MPEQVYVVLHPTTNIEVQDAAVLAIKYAERSTQNKMLQTLLEWMQIPAI